MPQNLGRKGHKENDPFLMFAWYIFHHMRVLPVPQWRKAFQSLTVDTQHDINELREFVFNELKKAGLYK